MNLNFFTSFSKQHFREYKLPLSFCRYRDQYNRMTPLKCKVVKIDTTLSFQWSPPLWISHHSGFFVPFLGCHFPSLSPLRYFFIPQDSAHSFLLCATSLTPQMKAIFLLSSPHISIIIIKNVIDRNIFVTDLLGIIKT